MRLSESEERQLDIWENMAADEFLRRTQAEEQAQMEAQVRATNERRVSCKHHVSSQRTHSCSTLNDVRCRTHLQGGRDCVASRGDVGGVAHDADNKPGEREQSAGEAAARARRAHHLPRGAGQSPGVQLETFVEISEGTRWPQRTGCRYISM